MFLDDYWQVVSDMQGISCISAVFRGSGDFVVELDRLRYRIFQYVLMPWA